MKITNEELRELYADARREVLGFPSADASPHVECLFRPTFDREGALFVFVGDDRPAEIVVRAAMASLDHYVDTIVRATAGDLAAIAPPRVMTARADLDDASRGSLRKLLATALEAPIVESTGRGRDGMLVDVVLRDGVTTQRRELFTVEDVCPSLEMVVRSAVDLATRLLKDTAVGEYLRTIQSYL